jgi:hypothetical protein
MRQVQKKYLNSLLLFENTIRLLAAYAGKGLDKRNVTSRTFQRSIQTLVNVYRFIKFLHSSFIPIKIIKKKRFKFKKIKYYSFVFLLK